MIGNVENNYRLTNTIMASSMRHGPEALTSKIYRLWWQEMEYILLERP
jgi:hypothetical protein